MIDMAKGDDDDGGPGDPATPSWFSPTRAPFEDATLNRMCACFSTFGAAPDVVGRRSSERAAATVRQAHWEGAEARAEGDWWINDGRCYASDFEFVNPEDVRVGRVPPPPPLGPPTRGAGTRRRTGRTCSRASTPHGGR